MDQLTEFEVQVRSNLLQVKESPDFIGERVWLTFYIDGADVTPISRALEAKGWQNVGNDPNSIYPKVQVTMAEAQIMEAVREAQEVCEEYAAEIYAIDADTSPQVEVSHFIGLFRA